MDYDILALAVIAILAVYKSFQTGFRMGQGVSKGEDKKPLKITLPTIENIKKRKENKEEKSRRETAERRLQIQMENIENYGTGVPQREIK